MRKSPVIDMDLPLPVIIFPAEAPVCISAIKCSTRAIGAYFVRLRSNFSVVTGGAAGHARLQLGWGHRNIRSPQ